MKTLKYLRKENILHYPRLDTILMVEDFIKKHNAECKKMQLWKALPKGINYRTFNTILDYLVYSGKIIISKDRKIVWVYNPKLVRKYLKRADLAWKSINYQ